MQALSWTAIGSPTHPASKQPCHHLHIPRSWGLKCTSKPRDPASLCEKRGLGTHSIILPGLGVEGPRAENVIHML